MHKLHLPSVKFTQLVYLLGMGWALALLGCSYFSPTYQKPNLALPVKWNATLPTMGPLSESLPNLAWWQQFHDQTLNQLIESGLINNMNVQVAKANLAAAQGQLLSLKLNWIPFLSVFGGYVSGNSQNSVTPIGNLGVINNTGGFLAVLPAYTLNIFTNYTLQKQATYNLEAVQNIELSVRLAVIGQVAAAYFVVLAHQQLVAQLTQLQLDLTDLLNLTQALNKRGLATQISIAELRSKQDLISGQLAVGAKNMAASQNALRFLLNQVPGKFPPPTNFAALKPTLILPGNLPVSVLAARPDVLAAEAKLKAANEGISVAASNLLPSVNLNYFYAQGSGSQGLNQGVNINSNNSNQQDYYAAYANWVISPSVFGQINTNTAIFKAALANYKYVVTNALHEVDNALEANNGYNQKMNSDLAAYANLTDVLCLQQALYQRGLTPAMLVIEAKLAQDALALDLTQTKLQQLISLVSVYQSLGGGYQYAESAPARYTNSH